jgi:cell division septal protein FtsQ
MTRAPRARRPRFRLLPTVLLTLAILGLPTVVYAWGRNSSAFDIVTIRVTGTRLVPDKRALRLLRQDYAGRNLFTVTGGDVRETLAPLFFVSGASIDRDFPDTLAVAVTEYEPAAYALAGDRWYVVDREGYVICTAAEAADQLAARARAQKPSPTSTPSADPTAGAAAAPAAEATAAATTTGTGASSDQATGPVADRLLAGPEEATLALPRIAVSGRVRRGAVVADDAAAEMLGVIVALPRSLQRRLAVVKSDDGRLSLRFAGGPLVTWGDSERTLAKVVALRTVLKVYEQAGKTCTTLDVSIPDRTLGKPVLQ